MSTSPFPSQLQMHHQLATTKTPEFVVLQNIATRQKFFTTNNPTEDQCLDCEGNVVYEVIAYANTVEEAQIILFGQPQHVF